VHGAEHTAHPGRQREAGQQNLVSIQNEYKIIHKEYETIQYEYEI
jgi:hypothetical protein